MRASPTSPSRPSRHSKNSPCKPPTSPPSSDKPAAASSTLRARSGTNQFHGTLYDYFAHEKFYAGRPFTNNGTGGHIRPQVRRHNLGANLGGPVVIPKLYDGRGRTFFFANFEMFRDEAINFYGMGTVPTEAYRAGNFAAALTGRNLGTDGLGRPILENTIYDPRSDRTGPDGRVYRDPFPGNLLPSPVIDPVALKVLGFIPKPVNSSLVNNYELRSPYRKIQDIPSVKVDHSLTDSAKVSVYYSRMRTDKDNGQDGLPDPISRRRDQPIRSHTIRINYDQTVRPTFLIHVGIGYQRYYNPDTVPPIALEFDPVAQLGLNGGFLKGFPTFNTLGTSQGGMNHDFGAAARTLYLQDKPIAVVNATLIRSNHTYKFGGEWKFENFTNRNTAGTAGAYNFAAAQTGLPALQGVALPGGNVGFPLASFLMGAVSTASVSNPADPQYRRPAWSLFAQDTWKLTRKITLDYGLRYDFQPAPRELHYRTSMFAPEVANPSAGGRLGATKYAGFGPGRCNCWPAETYKLALGPRLGVAYQVHVRRRSSAPASPSRSARWPTSSTSAAAIRWAWASTVSDFSTATFGAPAMLLREGLPVQHRRAPGRELRSRNPSTAGPGELAARHG